MLNAAARPRDLATGLVLSLGMHAVLLAALTSAGLLTRGAAVSGVISTVLPEELPAPEEVMLGGGDAETRTTSWLGADALPEQQAPRSEVEQPELSLSPGSPSAQPPSAPAGGPAPAALEPPRTEVQRTLETARDPAEAPDPHARTGPALPDPPLTTVATATPSPATAAGTAAASEPEAGAGRGVKSTSESAAAALQDAVSVVPGRVLSAKGLRISTRRPEWSATTRAIRNPGNAVMQVTFARDGTARRVQFLSDGRREFRTGFPDVDEPLVTALYQWTAQGEPLQRLPENDAEAGITVTFKILLTRG